MITFIVRNLSIRDYRFFVIPFVFLFISQIFAAKFIGNVKGIIIDSETNEPVPNAVIKISESDLFFTSKVDGSFEIVDLIEGNYSLEIDHLAYVEKAVNLNFNQNSDKNIVIYLVPKSVEINQVVVSTKRTESIFDDLAELSNVLKGRELEKDLGLTLAATLKNETGLAIRSMGPAPARPVIRGLGGDRVLISEDGSKTTDLSSTSPDHAVTIDPFSLQRIEVLRGPKVLMKTSTTIGGVVNVVRQEIPEEKHDHIYGTLGTYGETANKGYLGSAVIDVPINKFQFRGEFSGKKASDLNTPVGELKNSFSDNLNYSFGGSYFTDFGFIGGSYRFFDLQYGVPGGFVGAHPNGVNIEMFRKQWNVKSRINIKTKSFDNIDISFSRVLYRHKEIESNAIIGAEFRILNHIGYVNFNHNKISFLNSGTLGISFEARDFDIGGFVFTSPTNSINVSTYLIESFNYDKLNFEFGARYNFDKITPEAEKPNAKIGTIRERTFNTYSLSFSTLYELTKKVYAGFNVSKSSRVPTIEELYSEGPHLAAYSYEIGNPELEAESGFGSELFIYHKFDNLYFNINLFRNDLSNYIIPRNTGDTNFQTFLPIYATSGVEAILYGIENQVDWNATKNISISSTVSYTKGEFKGSGNPLPQIPPLKGRVGIKYSVDKLSLELNTEFAAKQDNVDEFEEPTAGYVIFNSALQYSFSTNGLIHNLSLNFDNIFNKEYRNHLSRVKSILPEAGRNLRLTYKMFFDVE